MTHRTKHWYDGPILIGRNKFPSKEVRQAYFSWRDQRLRAERGYGSREFIGWWLSNLKNRRWKSPQCGRINHSLGYYFGNIVMQDRLVNNRERLDRCGHPSNVQRKPIASYNLSTGKIIKRFLSHRSAARYYRINQATVWWFLKYKPKKTKCGVGFVEVYT
jgi:hypothetical protein